MHHRLNGHEFEQIPGDSEGQGSLVCCSSQRVGHDLATEEQQDFPWLSKYTFSMTFRVVAYSGNVSLG